MSHVRFDPSKAVTFDLSHGLVHLEGAPARLLVPAGALGALLGSAGAEATRAFGRALGASIGRRAATRLSGGDGLGAATADAVLEHLGGELALAGLGSLSLERWGRALVLVVDRSPLEAAGDALLEAVLAGAFEAASGKPVEVLALGRDSTRARFLTTGTAGAEKVRSWLAEGVPWGDALVRLHARPTAAKESPAGAESSEAPAAKATAGAESSEAPAIKATAGAESSEAPATKATAGAESSEAPAIKATGETQSGEMPVIKAPAAPKPAVATVSDDDLDSWEAATTEPTAPPRGDA